MEGDARCLLPSAEDMLLFTTTIHAAFKTLRPFMKGKGALTVRFILAIKLAVVEGKLEPHPVMEFRHVDDDVGLGELHDARADVWRQRRGRGELDCDVIGRVDISGNLGIVVDEAALGGSDNARGRKVFLPGLVAVPWQIRLVDERVQVTRADAVDDLACSLELLCGVKQRRGGAQRQG